jgi:thymidine phosphorylase
MLKVRPFPIDTFRQNVVVLHRTCSALRPERLRGTRKVEVRVNGRTILADIVISDDASMVGCDEVGLSQPAFRRLAATPGALVEISPAPAAGSLDAVRAKVRGETLGAAQLHEVVRDLAAHRYSDMEVAAFLIACASFMTPEETLALTQAMIDVGKRLDWGRAMVVDKHCIGGIPGNRTSPLVVAIVAAHGLLIPKTSSRAITSPAGTADTMEVLARVDLSEDEMRTVVEKCGGCLIWGGRVDLSPADDVLISVERPLSIDTPEQMVASILSKKVAAGSTHLVIDMPVGPFAKLRDPSAAMRLRKLFEYVGSRLGLHIDIMATDGSQPIGRGVGPVLEARDVLAVLQNRTDAPADLKEKAIELAGRTLEFDAKVAGGSGAARARELLESGAAMAKLEEIAAAQGPSPVKNEVAPLCYEVTAAHSGWVEAVDCLRIARIARMAGAPTDPGAGLELLKRNGDAVRAGEPLYRIHGLDPADFGFAKEAADEISGFKVTA